MAPYPKITTYPPLGQLTIIPPEQDHVHFILVVEWNLVRPAYPFEFALAYNGVRNASHESQWPRIPLRRASKATSYLLGADECQRAVYAAKLSREDLSKQNLTLLSAGHSIFTVAFRVNTQAPWQWVSIQDGTSPGELLLQQSLKDLDISNDENLFREHVSLTSDWTYTLLDGSVNSPSRTFLLESKTAIQKPTDSSFATLPLAEVSRAVRYFSTVRLEPYWLGPRQGRGPPSPGKPSFFHLDEDAIVTSFLLDNGLVVTFVVLGWVDDVYQVIQSDDQGQIVIAAQNDNDTDKHYKLIMSTGLDFHETMSSAMTQVQTVISTSTKITSLNNTTKDIVSSLDPVKTKESTEQWLDSLSFCTWNALGQDLTSTKILNALDQLREHNIHISTLLIDDNWQTLGTTKYDYSDPFFRGWADIEANTSAAPTGLKDLITTIRTQNPHLKDIGVWHALMGYWGGISPHGKIASQYPTIEIDALLMGNIPGKITTVAPDALHRFYSDFYTFLKNSGLTFVKTDVQHMLSTYQTPETRRDLISTYQSAWTSAHLAHFSGKAISCMSQTPQTLFHSLLQTNTPAIVHRNSDDFYPEVPASHPWHIWVNAHNAVFTQHLNVVPDWDMFQTDHEFSAYHAAARCVSGGPLLITDVPGRHDTALIEQMVARAFGGASIALRTGLGVVDCVFGFYTEGVILKVGADAGAGRIMALFNVLERDVRGFVHVDEFRLLGRDGCDEVLVRSHRTSQVFGPISLRTIKGSTATTSDNEGKTEDKVSEHELSIETKKLLHINLPVRGWDILTAQPIHNIALPSNRNIKVCVLGLLGKMSGAAAITASSINLEDDGKIRVQVTLKALGKLGIWFNDGPFEDTIAVNVQGCPIEERFWKLTSVPESRNNDDTTNAMGSGEDGGLNEADTDTDTNAVQGGPHIYQVDVEAYWSHKNLWDIHCKAVNVELVVG